MNPLNRDEGNQDWWEREWYRRQMAAIDTLNDRVRDLEEYKWKLIGIAIGSGAVFGLVFKLIFK